MLLNTQRRTLRLCGMGVMTNMRWGRRTMKRRPRIMSAAHTRLIVEHVSTICGHVKDKVVERVASHYGFKTSNKDHMIQANKELAGKLLGDDGYIFEI
ncbi:hypothetical protein JB92DRAFT_2274945 [Gautieria morchelliformis]|nr:hypothetical protein JB92DRAFT_2274945 [Gautieria morchelliformis]